MPDLSLPSAEDVRHAAEIIRPHIRRTPTVEIAAEDFGLSGAPLTFKLEFMQVSGAFKARGAFANLLLREGTKAGVVAASGGNHGAAVAYAGMRLGIPAHIFVPKISSPAKIERIKSYGADIHVGGATYADAYDASHKFAAERGLVEVHAYASRETLIGQGSIAVEWVEQSPGLDTVVVAVGGGGLIGGMAAFCRGRPKIVGVEPEQAPTLTEALKAGTPVDVDVSGVAADSLGARRLGPLTLPLAQRYVAQVSLVTDAEIVAAQKRLWDVVRIVVEPGAAAAMAVLLSGKYTPSPTERVGVLLCGANTTAVDFDRT